MAREQVCRNSVVAETSKCPASNARCHAKNVTCIADIRLKLRTRVFADARRLHDFAVKTAVAIKTDFAIHHLTRPCYFAGKSSSPGQYLT